MITRKDEIQSKLQKISAKIGQKYTHYKGGEYEVIALAIKEDTLEPLIIYRSSQQDNTVWARTYTNWSETVEIAGQKIKRFTLSV